ERCFCMYGAKTRASTSVSPPAANPTTSSMGLSSGHAAQAGVLRLAPSSMAAHTADLRGIAMVDLQLLICCSIRPGLGACRLQQAVRLFAHDGVIDGLEVKPRHEGRSQVFFRMQRGLAVDHLQRAAGRLGFELDLA